jgi:DNA (cytosine-5)-methyltransferase 1
LSEAFINIPAAPLRPRAEREDVAARSNALQSAKQQISAAQQALSLAMFDLFDSVHRLMQDHFDSFTDIEAWLKTECRISEEDITTYKDFESTLGSHKHLLADSGVAFETIKALVRADAATRDGALDVLKAGSPVSPALVRSIARARELDRMSPLQRRAREQRLFFRRKIHEQGQYVVSALQASARELYTVLMGIPFYGVHDHRSLEADAVADELRFKVVQKDIAQRARQLLTRLDELGIAPTSKVEDWLTVGLTNPADQNMAEARHALELLENSSTFRPGQQIYESKDYYWTIEDGIFHLTGLSPKAQVRPPILRRGETLTSLEICAGIGGEAIGLMAAGFDAVALFDNNNRAVETLKVNWPDWNSVKRDVTSQIGRKEILSHRGTLDLLSGGVPCQPFSRGGKHRGEFDSRQLFGDAADYVRELQPRAFAFENVVGFTGGMHSDFRRRLEADFASLGYKTHLCEMNAADYGLSQDRVRVVLVGLKRGYAGNFRPPVLAKPVVKGFAETIADALFPHLGRKEDSAQQALYDTWARKWLAAHGGKRAPTIVGTTRAKTSLVRRWEEVGFKLEIKSAAFSVEDISTTDELPHLTPLILKRLQGIPDGWTIEGESSPGKVSKPIANAFPPVMARAIGLRIREALTGELEDLDRAMAEPIIDVSLVGGRRNVFDFQSSFARFTKALPPSKKAERWRRDILLQYEESEAPG